MADTQGPYIRWINYGHDGWQPQSFPTLRDAVIGDRYGSEFVITKVADFDIVERETPVKAA